MNAPVRPEDEGELEQMLGLIRERHHYDFSEYARPTLRRCFERAAARRGCPTLAALRELLIMQPRVFDGLIDDLTIRVTEGFRDPWYFRGFREHVVPRLRTFPFQRVWVAGCSTGEEAYSIAVILAEEQLLRRTWIYATDINPTALHVAERGTYASSQFAQFARNHELAGGRRPLGDFVAHDGEVVRFDPELRSHIVFADHSLATDSVFAEVQAVSCRNVLIYFDRSLQDRALGLFAEALPRGGALGLGPSETVRFSRWEDRFTELTTAPRWYLRASGGTT